MKGRGLNSIQLRFTILMAVMSTVLATSILAFDGVYHLHDLPLPHVIAVIAISAAVPSALMYTLAGKLTGLISALRRSTEAIASGDFNAPVDVNCECDVGGLADSFRTMVARLNSNILRMNILAYSDPVTSLPNRAVLTHVLETSLSVAKTKAFTGAVLFIDLDRFKHVNDTLGHDAGDELLRMASQRILCEGLQRTLETIDHCMTPFGELCDRAPTDILLVRFAGDEFVAVLPGLTAHEEIAAVASRIVQALQKPFRLAGTDITIGGSIGIARTPMDSRDAAELVNFADLAMYAAKQGGRSDYAFFDGTMREAALQRANLERELREALARDHLVLHLQPKVACHSLDVSGFEALVRWQHPVRGLVMPGDFIEIAEQSGLIEDLGRRVLELAMRQTAQWRRDGIARRISVNVSPIQFARSCFASEIVQALQSSGAVASDIEIELTESTAMLDYRHTLNTLQTLREAGFRIAIDDFGCGFSNLSQLSQLPFDCLKIDRSLISTLGRDKKGENVVRAIIGLGHSLGHEVVAEGVETLRQFHFLQGENCDQMQGYLFARPMAIADVPAWIERRTGTSLEDRTSDIAQRWQTA